MVGRFLVLALVCVSLTQVKAIERLEYEIEKALFRLNGMASGAEKGIDGTMKEVAYKRNSTQEKTSIFVSRETRLETQLKQNIERTADEMERSAEESKKPPSCFECIAKAEKEAVARLEAVGPKFQVDMKRLERTKLDNMDVTSKPLSELKSSLPQKFRQAEAEVRSCKDVVSVRKVMDRVRRDYDLLNSELRRIVTQVGTYYSQFLRDASNLFTNVSRQATRIQTEGSRAIKACVYRKAFFPF